MSRHRERERESYVMSKIFAIMCWCGKSKLPIFNFSAVVEQVSPRSVRVKIRIFFPLLFGEIFVKITIVDLKMLKKCLIFYFLFLSILLFKGPLLLGFIIFLVQKCPYILMFKYR